MSTRANIIIKDSYSKLFFYRHSDGYPEGTMPLLNKFVGWIKNKTIRNNIQQSAGWLIILGALEYNTIPKCEFDAPSYPGSTGYGKIETIEDPTDWKCGAIEPTTAIHGDIDYLYIIDVDNKTIECYDAWTEDGEGTEKVELPAELILK
jgi:hypothetical protein